MNVMIVVYVLRWSYLWWRYSEPDKLKSLLDNDEIEMFQSSKPFSFPDMDTLCRVASSQIIQYRKNVNLWHENMDVHI
jgi:hypothetical protein